MRRADSSFLNAVITNVTSTGNAGDGMDVDAQGNDRFDVNQPMSGTANMVTVNDSSFNNNGQNGARYRIHGDAIYRKTLAAKNNEIVFEILSNLLNRRIFEK